MRQEPMRQEPTAEGSYLTFVSPMRSTRTTAAFIRA